MKRTWVTASAVVLVTAVGAGYEAVIGRLTSTPMLTIVAFYAASSGIIISFAVWTAREVGLPSFLVLQAGTARERWLRLLVHGVGMGIVLSVASATLAANGQAGVLRPWFWRQIQTPVGSVLVAARSALLEETFFRLFLVSFLVSVGLRMRPRRYRLRVRGGSAQVTETIPEPWRWLVLAAVLVSSLLFGLVHVFNPVPAMLLGPFLAHSYLRGGWESAVVAHFVANWLVFALYY